MSSLYDQDLYKLGEQFQQQFGRPGAGSVEPKKSKTGLIIALVVIVLLILIVIGIIIGVAVSKKNKKKEEK